MKYARLFAALAFVCALAASQSPHPLAAFLLIWNAISFAVLARAYATRRPLSLGKRANGTLNPLHTLVLLPYHALNALSYSLACLLSRGNAADEIISGVWLSRRLNRFDHAVLRSVAPRFVLDAAAEMPEARPLRSPGVVYKSLPLLDTTAPEPEELSAGADWIGWSLAQGPVLVHCALGHGRSATLVAAFLLRSRQAATVEEALDLIRARRPRIELSQQQIGALQVLATRQDEAFL